MAKANKEFWESSKYNSQGYLAYYNRLVELSMAMFEWKNLPDTVDPRFMELTLFSKGHCLFFKDEVMGHLALPAIIGGRLNVYNVPLDRTAFATNGYQNKLTADNSVIIYNNFLRTPAQNDVEMFARRLYDIDRTIDINIKAQKTPILIQADEKDRLTMKNLYMQYDGNQPFIFGSKNIDFNSLKVMNTNAPYIADRLNNMKTAIWNEALTYLGIANTNIVKKERLITDEVLQSQGGTVRCRYSRLYARKQACNEINKMFGLNIDVDYRDNFISAEDMAMPNSEEVEDNE